ncbi:MAG: glycosyltransferase family 4 protein [Candidatus Sericytochromatia bacterium]|nr:glycosyltransferase family 4 protein [Candidatus Sericytochromatia bacterium]
MAPLPRLLYTAFDVVPAPKGASLRIQNMLAALSERFEVKALLLGEPGQSPQERWGKVQVEKLIAPESAFLEKTIHFAEWVLQEALAWQPAVIQFRSLWDGFVLSQYRQQFPQAWQLVYELHGLPEIELEHHFPDLPAQVHEKIRKQQALLLPQADFWLCPSQVHQAYLIQQGIPADKIGVVGNGADPDLFHTAVTAPPQDKPLIIYLGTLAPWQGLETLLEACQHLLSSFQLRLVGKGNPRWQQNLLAKSYQLGLTASVEIVDPLPHSYMPQVLAPAQIAVAPLSNNERNQIQGCNPIKIFEYMAAGKAIVAPDLPVVREILTHQETGWLYAPEEDGALRAALEYLLQHPEERTRLGQAAREKLLSSYTWQHRQTQVLDFFRKALPL